jgi:hypothetical protein
VCGTGCRGLFWSRCPRKHQQQTWSGSWRRSCHRGFLRNTRSRSSWPTAHSTANSLVDDTLSPPPYGQEQWTDEDAQVLADAGEPTSGSPASAATPLRFGTLNALPLTILSTPHGRFQQPCLVAAGESTVSAILSMDAIPAARAPLPLVDGVDRTAGLGAAFWAGRHRAAVACSPNQYHPYQVILGYRNR